MLITDILNNINNRRNKFSKVNYGNKNGGNCDKNKIDLLIEFIVYYEEEKINIKSITRYNISGKLHGKTEGFYKNGKKHYELNYREGKPHGRQFINWINQKPFIEFNYNNGKPEGHQTEYSAWGTVQWQLYCSGDYINPDDSKKITGIETQIINIQ